MAKKVYEESKILAIADAIREKTGNGNLYNTAEMPNGVAEVYKAGQDEILDKLWDSIQDKGARTDYGYFFMNWDGASFYPKYDMNLAGVTIHGSYANVGIFRSFNSKGETKFDLTTRLKECGVVLNTSQVQSFQYFMYSINVSRIPTIDLSLAENTYMTFYNTEIEIIDKLIISEKTNFATNAFQYSSLLKEITEVEGVIAKNVAFQSSPLDAPTINRIIACLMDYSTTGGTHTLTLKADRETMLTDAEKAVATNKGWTLVWS